jgi:hypothetical protein
MDRERVDWFDYDEDGDGKLDSVVICIRALSPKAVAQIASTEENTVSIGYGVMPPVRRKIRMFGIAVIELSVMDSTQQRRLSLERVAVIFSGLLLSDMK